MAQSHEVFKALFEAYADIPLANGSGHMSLSALVRFGADFGLFPTRWTSRRCSGSTTRSARHGSDSLHWPWLEAHGKAAVSPSLTGNSKVFWRI